MELFQLVDVVLDLLLGVGQLFLLQLDLVVELVHVLLRLDGLALLQSQLLDVRFFDGLLNQVVQVLDLLPQLGVGLLQSSNVDAISSEPLK